MAQANLDDAHWVTPEWYEEKTGEGEYVIKERIRTGLWAAGVHYKRIGSRTLRINYTEANRWFSQQPHVEAYSQKASNLGKARAVHA